MIASLLQHLDTLLLYVFCACALLGALSMLVLRRPMRVAMSLITTMVFLGGIYGLLGVHFIAAFQVLIYVGAVMVFMVYVIMLLEVRESTGTIRYSAMLLPGIVAALTFTGVLGYGVWRGYPALIKAATGTHFGMQQFSVAFLDEYWLHFELTSVLLVAAVVAAMAVIKVNRRLHG
jgi:NADH-quinone oxidoreductase subunit J